MRKVTAEVHCSRFQVHIRRQCHMYAQIFLQLSRKLVRSEGSLFSRCIRNISVPTQNKQELRTAWHIYVNTQGINI